MSPLARILDRFVWFYQQVSAGRPPSCRFDPSCSSYARDALATHGGIRGGWLAIRRLLRCNPWGGQGHDPVPGAGRTPHDRACSTIHRHA